MGGFIQYCRRLLSAVSFCIRRGVSPLLIMSCVYTDYFFKMVSRELSEAIRMDCEYIKNSFEFLSKQHDIAENRGGRYNWVERSAAVCEIIRVGRETQERMKSTQSMSSYLLGWNFVDIVIGNAGKDAAFAGYYDLFYTLDSSIETLMANVKVGNSWCFPYEVLDQFPLEPMGMVDRFCDYLSGSLLG
jgi:hypothetical protein